MIEITIVNGILQEVIFNRVLDVSTTNLSPLCTAVAFIFVFTHKNVYDANEACEQKFLSCMAFNVYKVVRFSCLCLYVCLYKQTNHATEKRHERLRKRQKSSKRETAARRVK